MTRVRDAVASRRRRHRIMKAAQGFRGTRRRLYRAAKEAIWHALKYSYIHRRQRKGDFRKLWISRINAASRGFGLTYSRFMSGLKRHEVRLNRKMLAELALRDPQAFAKLIELARS